MSAVARIVDVPGSEAAKAAAAARATAAKLQAVPSSALASLQPLAPDTDTLIGRAIKRVQRSIELRNAPPAEVGTTPKDVLYERGTMRLYHYHAQSEEIYRVPVLLVMATTNRGYLFDLESGNSMVEYLLQRGFDVYMLDWEAPTLSERGLGLADYTQDFLPTAVRLIQEDCGEEDVSIVGYCQGGVLSLIYAATHADGPLKNLMLFTTPVDQHKMELARIWSDRRYMDVDQIIATHGNMPAAMITQYFDMLRPGQRLAGQLTAYEQLWNDEFIESYRKMQRWSDEMLPLAGNYYRDTTKELLWDNKLLTGELEQNGKSANLANIKVPIFHAAAKFDHIVPYAASEPLMGLVSSEDQEELVLSGGHVSLIAGPRAAKRLWPKMDQWLAPRSM